MSKQIKFPPLPLGGFNRGGERNRVHSQVQKQRSEYEPGHFTALCRAPSDALPLGWPPAYNWGRK